MSYQTDKKSVRLSILLIAAIVVVLGAIAYTVASKKSDDKREVSAQEASDKRASSKLGTSDTSAAALRATTRKNSAKQNAEIKPDQASESEEGEEGLFAALKGLMELGSLMEDSIEDESEGYLAPIRHRLGLTKEQEAQYRALLAKKREIDKKGMSNALKKLEGINFSELMTLSEDEARERLGVDSDPEMTGLTEEEAKIYNADEKDLLADVLDEQQQELYGKYMEERKEAELEHDSASKLADLDEELHLSSEQRDAVYEAVVRHGGENPPLSEMKEILNDWQWKRYNAEHNPAAGQVQTLKRDKSVGLTEDQAQRIMQLGAEKGRQLESDELQSVITDEQYRAYEKQSAEELKESAKLLEGLLKGFGGNKEKPKEGK